MKGEYRESYGLAGCSLGAEEVLDACAESLRAESKRVLPALVGKVVISYRPPKGSTLKTGPSV